MHHRILGTLAAAVVALTCGSGLQAQSAPALKGVWRVTQVVVTGVNASTNSSPQPGMYMFTDRHYSLLTVGGTAPRKTPAPIKVAGKPTPAEMQVRYDEWAVFAANSGTYSVKGSTLTTRPIVAKNHGVMTGPDQIRDFKIAGSTLTLVQRADDGKTETRTTLTRIE